jgi:hypothetical protein
MGDLFAEVASQVPEYKEAWRAHRAEADGEDIEQPADYVELKAIVKQFAPLLDESGQLRLLVFIGGFLGERRRGALRDLSAAELQELYDELCDYTISIARTESGKGHRPLCGLPFADFVAALTTPQSVGLSEIRVQAACLPLNNAEAAAVQSYDKLAASGLSVSRAREEFRESDHGGSTVAGFQV